MQLHIKLFGITKDIVGGTSLVLALPEGSTVADLSAHLVQQYPAMRGLRSLAIARNGEYAEPEEALHERDELALIPPVSGG